MINYKFTLGVKYIFKKNCILLVFHFEYFSEFIFHNSTEVTILYLELTLFT